MILKFPADALAGLLDHAISSPEHVPTPPQLRDETLFIEGAEPNELEILSGLGGDSIDRRKVPPGLVLTYDGVYWLSSNGSDPLPEGDHRVEALVDGPSHSSDVPRMRAQFVGFVPVEVVSENLRSDKDLTIRLHKDDLLLSVPRQRS